MTQEAGSMAFSGGRGCLSTVSEILEDIAPDGVTQFQMISGDVESPE